MRDHEQPADGHPLKGQGVQSEGAFVRLVWRTVSSNIGMLAQPGLSVGPSFWPHCADPGGHRRLWRRRGSRRRAWRLRAKTAGAAW